MYKNLSKNNLNLFQMKNLNTEKRNLTLRIQVYMCVTGKYIEE